ncbi:radical SAM (seleno)protein TrsS [Acetobacterium bakii]|uniref:Radical SAM core domain-containing protein n=1 Tax=Acetobacterium bakii TaxID=52689 RepID=A0A0L6U4K1_9FIRM|nr:radical SAM (seleno)protein TrsS [Acetobacterium bakii]KNZ43428.1 hypothetical protein AKG39_01645 [Acetobacterium bakii]
MNEKTKSICPVCHKTISALRIQKGNKIYLHKECDLHGKFEALLWDASTQGGGGYQQNSKNDINSEECLEWQNWTTEAVNTIPAVFDTKSNHNCPHDCGLCESHQQQACCVLIEITQNCDQNCNYCFASAHSSKGKSEDLSLGEIREMYASLLARNTGRSFNIQLSGGEPTMREDLPEIIRMGKEMGFPYIQLNTNGRRLATDPAYARKLHEAGLSSVFLQFDGTEEAIYENIRGKPLLELKEKAIENCAAAELGTVLVVTVVPGVNDHNLGDILRYGIKRLPFVRGIHFQPVSYFGRFPHQPLDTDRITIPQLIGKLVIQSEDKLKTNQFVPLQTGHPVCSFHGNFLIMEDGGLISLDSDPNKCGCGYNEDSIERARNYIAKKWTYKFQRIAEKVSKDYDYSSWDRLLAKINSHGFSITAMAFQDAWNLDLERLQKCRVQVAVKGNKLIPFCAYNILHRPNSK